MHYIDPHIHMVSRTTDDYKRMALAGCVLVSEPAFWEGFDRSGPEGFRDYFRQLTQYERNRARMEQLKPHHRNDYASDVTIDRRLTAYRREAMTPQQRAATRPPPTVAFTRTALPPPPAPIEMTGKYVRCPTLFIHTGRGKIGSADITRETIERNMQAADLEYVVIKEAGHWPWLEDPEQVLAILEPFLARTAA